MLEHNQIMTEASDFILVTRKRHRNEKKNLNKCAYIKQNHRTDQEDCEIDREILR